VACVHVHEIGEARGLHGQGLPPATDDGLARHLLGPLPPRLRFLVGDGAHAVDVIEAHDLDVLGAVGQDEHGVDRNHLATLTAVERSVLDADLGA